MDVDKDRVEDPAAARELVEPERLADLEKKGYVLTGDVHAVGLACREALTPVPGGVGPLTIALLMKNTVRPRTPEASVLRVGLTGSCVGKTYVRRRMQDAARPSTWTWSRTSDGAGGAAYDDVLAEFGDGRCRPPTGPSIARSSGLRVFADPAARARLNAIVHPRVREEEDRRAAALAAAGATCW